MPEHLPSNVAGTNAVDGGAVYTPGLTPSEEGISLAPALSGSAMEALWQKVVKNDTGTADVLAGVTEEALNDFLAAHHKNDAERYQLKTRHKFVVNGREREFQLTVHAKQALSITLPPIPVEGPTIGWNEIDSPDTEPYPHYPTSKDEPNIRVVCRSIVLTLEWPNLSGGKPWQFKFDPFEIWAEGAMVLVQQDGASHLRVIPKRIAFDKTAQKLLSDAVARTDESSSSAVRAMSEELEKAFNDLLLIALNITATRAGPQMVQNVLLPAPSVAGVTVYPAAMMVADKKIAVAASMDKERLVNSNRAKVRRGFAHAQALLEEDIAANGGLIPAVTKDRLTEIAEDQAPVFIEPDDYPERFPKTWAYITELERRSQPSIVRGPVSPGKANAGIALAVNQYMLEEVARRAMPDPTADCTDWASLAVARGRACWWLHINAPVVTIADTTVSGTVRVDIGGALEACTRKFWDCSWRWTCASLALAIRGNPGIRLEFAAGNGIEFYAKLTGKIELQSNLPFPFDKVVEAVSGVVISALMMVVNLVIGNMRLRIVPGVVRLPEQATGLQLSSFKPFPFLAESQATLPSKKVFIGYQADTAGVKV